LANPSVIIEAVSERNVHRSPLNDLDDGRRISNIENFFSVTLIVFILGKAKNKKKVRTS